MRRRARLVGPLVVLTLAGAGCGGSADSTARPVAAPAAQVLDAPEPPQRGPAASADDVELEVTGFHVLPAPAGDPVAERSARSLGVPVTRIAQLHLMLAVTNTGRHERSVAGDLLHLDVSGRTLEPLPGPLLPPGPLAGGSRHEAAAGFYIAVRAGERTPVLRWTHRGRTAVLPLGGVRRSA